MISTAALAAAFAAIMVAALGLAVLIVAARATRLLREKAAEAAVAPHRTAMIVVGSDEDTDGEGLAHLLGVDHDSRRRLGPAVVAMLSKVRGRPAEDLATVLREHGHIDSALSRLRSRSLVRRAGAAHLLGLVKDPDHVEQLLPLLEDRSWEVRMVTVRALGAIGDPQAAPGILNALRPIRGHVGVPAYIAAEAVLSMGDGAAYAVRDGLNSPDAVVRNACALVAGQSNLSSATGRLRELLATDADLEVRVSAATALGLIGGAEDMGALASATVAGEAPMLRRTAAAALGYLGDTRAADALLALLADADRRLAEIAARALIRLGPTGLARLVEVPGDGPAGRVARSALAAARLPEVQESAA